MLCFTFIVVYTFICLEVWGLCLRPSFFWLIPEISVAISHRNVQHYFDLINEPTLLTGVFPSIASRGLEPLALHIQIHPSLVSICQRINLQYIHPWKNYSSRRKYKGHWKTITEPRHSLWHTEVLIRTNETVAKGRLSINIKNMITGMIQPLLQLCCLLDDSVCQHYSTEKTTFDCRACICSPNCSFHETGKRELTICLDHIKWCIQEML